MELIALLLALWKDFPNPEFGGPAVAQEVGRIVSQGPREWAIEPSDPRFVKATLYFRDLKAGKGLLTTIEIELREPWHSSLSALTAAFGSKFRWLPRPDWERPRDLQFEPKTSPLDSVLMLTVSEEHGQQLTITKISLRRFYPTPK